MRSSALFQVMTITLRRAAIILLALMCAMLTSCLELYDEEMIIHADLSGSAKVTVKLPDILVTKFDSVREEFAEGKIRERFSSLNGVKLNSYSITEGRFPVATFEVSFSSLQKLSAAAEGNAPAALLIGVFNIKKENGNMVVERKLGEGQPSMSLPLDKYAVYKMHFNTPVEVVSTNSEFFDKSHSDVRYRWPLATIQSQRPLISNRFVKPMPWMEIALGFLILCVIARIAMGIFSKRKTKTPVPATTPGETASGAPAPPQAPQRPGPPRRPGPPQ